MNERRIIHGFWSGTCVWIICDDGTMHQGARDGFKHIWRRIEGPPKDLEGSDEMVTQPDGQDQSR